MNLGLSGRPSGEKGGGQITDTLTLFTPALIAQSDVRTGEHSKDVEPHKPLARLRRQHLLMVGLADGPVMKPRGFRLANLKILMVMICLFGKGK